MHGETDVRPTFSTQKMPLSNLEQLTTLQYRSTSVVVSASVNMRVAWEQGNPQIKVIFCYAVLYYNMGTGTSMAGQAMAG